MEFEAEVQAAETALKAMIDKVVGEEPTTRSVSDAIRLSNRVADELGKYLLPFCSQVWPFNEAEHDPYADTGENGWEEDYIDDLWKNWNAPDFLNQQLAISDWNNPERHPSWWSPSAYC